MSLPSPISRRSLLKTLPVLGGAGLVGGYVAGCTPEPTTGAAPGDVSAPERTPVAPSEAPEAGRYDFFAEEEVRLLEAMLARLVPGDDADPGAVQMGVARYIDHKLATFETYAEPTYTQGPFAEGFEQDPAEVETGSVAVDERQLYRYGYQGQRPPQDVYRLGLAALDRYAQTRYGRFFADLSERRQDEILMVLDDHGARAEAAESRETQSTGTTSPSPPTPDDVLDQAEDVFGEVSPGEFFALVREDTIEGMFADPLYGGNRDMAGWALVGWPAAQRSYSPQEMLDGTTKQPQPLHGLPVMNPDRPGDGGRPALEQPRHGTGDH